MYLPSFISQFQYFIYFDGVEVEISSFMTALKVCQFPILLIASLNRVIVIKPLLLYTTFPPILF